MNTINENDKENNVASLQAYLRIRPFTKKERECQSNKQIEEIYDIHENKNTIAVRIPSTSVYGHRKTISCEMFKFTHIFCEDDGQKVVFDEIMKPCLQAFLKMKSILVFAYGITNSGKSYTVRGTREDAGLIPRFASSLFQLIRECKIIYPKIMPITVNHSCLVSLNELKQSRSIIDSKLRDVSERVDRILINNVDCGQLQYTFKDLTDNVKVESTPQALASLPISQTSSSEKDRTNCLNLLNNDQPMDTQSENVLFEACGIWCSYTEIYNDLVFDLLSERRRSVALGEDRKNYPFVKGLTRVPVFSAAEILGVFDAGRQKLHMAHTQLNTNSSRSHSIFSIIVVSKVTANASTMAIRSFEFCDLAGAERIEKSGAVGTNQVEACKINTSLTALHRCIECLRLSTSSNKKRQCIRPSYRESKLTRLFQPFFEGFGFVRMITAVSPNVDSFDETINVLRFASLAQKVQMEQKVIETVIPAPTNNTKGQVRKRQTSNLNNLVEINCKQAKRMKVRQNKIGSETVVENRQSSITSHDRVSLMNADIVDLVYYVIEQRRRNAELKAGLASIQNDWEAQLDQDAKTHWADIKQLNERYSKLKSEKISSVCHSIKESYRSTILELREQIQAARDTLSSFTSKKDEHNDDKD